MAINIVFMKKVIIFDFDGVIIQTFNIAFERTKHFIPDLTEEKYREMFEDNIFDSWKEAGLDVEKTKKQFFEDYEDDLLRLQPVKGVREVILKLANDSILIINSSTRSSVILDFLNLHGLAKYFTEVLGSEVSQSKSEKIKQVLKTYNIKPEETVMITDTDGDVEEATFVGVESIGVTWGYHTREMLNRAQIVIDTPEELLEVI